MTEGRRTAILIAASEFPEEPSLQTLRCPKNDVAGLAEALTSPDFGLFTDPLTFINEPSHSTLRAVNRVFKEAGREDQILIYYSGHGKQDGAGNLYLATSDTEADTLETSSIAVGTLRRLIDNYACKQVALVLDCCFGGAVSKDFLKGGVDDHLKQTFHGRGIYILTASTATQTAREKEGDEYSLFTKHILQGIRQGEADRDDDGLISLDDLYEYVKTRVPKEAPQYPTKWEFGVQGNSLFIARAARTFSPERRRAFREKIKSVDDYLLPDVFDQAYKVIRENQPKRDKEFFDLLESLCEERMTIGEFSFRWLKLAPARAPEKGDDAPPPLPPLEKKEESPSPVEIPPQEKKAPPVASAPSLQEEKASPGTPAQPLPQQEKKDQAPPPIIETIWQGKNVARKSAEAEEELHIEKNFCKRCGAMAKPYSRFCETCDHIPNLPKEDLVHGTEKDGPVSESFIDNLMGVPLEMIFVPGGTFKMGAPKGKGNDGERPQHDVTVPDFYIGKYPITQAQWKATMGKNSSHFKGDPTLPVEIVLWNDAKKFCEMISQITGKAYRLPSEAEWEYACRAGTTGDYAGDLDAMAWYSNNSGGKTHPVGRKQPNAFGLYDMHGNVWEWCEDVWHANYDGAPVDGSPWLSGGSSYRMLRGGSWGVNSVYCRSAHRYNNAPGNSNNNLGFRIVVGLQTA
jgi:formylglycine-generating enzyme required for sulfatase activity